MRINYPVLVLQETVDLIEFDATAAVHGCTWVRCRTLEQMRGGR